MGLGSVRVRVRIGFRICYGRRCTVTADGYGDGRRLRPTDVSVKVKVRLRSLSGLLAAGGRWLMQA